MLRSLAPLAHQTPDSGIPGTAVITSAVEVLDYTQATATHHGRLLAHVRRSGAPRAAHNLIIAAHGAETGRIILTRDAKARFSELPGVSALDA